MDSLREKLVGYQHIIWDWNGTILADVEQIWRATAATLAQFNLPPVSVEAYRRDFCLPLEVYYQKLGFDLGTVSYTEVAKTFQREYLRCFSEAEVFPGTHSLLGDIKAAGKTNSLLSAAGQKMLDHSVAHYGVAHYFTHIYGVPNELARGKGARGLELMRETGFAHQKTLLIGDTDHDLEVGTEMGIEVLLIADGHQSYERLRDLHHNVLESRFN
jgi:phosphoglycolate phosphatase